LTSDDIKPLRVAGLTDLEIYDIAQSAAMFAWANRLMQTLGDAVYPQ
jgi:alkylhydroperoxidase family enzyme